MTPTNTTSDAQERVGYRDMEPEALVTLANAQVVDVREPDEYVGELGHIPGSILVPLGELSAKASALARDRPTVVVCRSGRRSARGAELLTALGFERVFNLRGGMQAYRAAGLLTERGPCPR